MATGALQEHVYSTYVFSPFRPSTLGGVVDKHLHKQGTTGLRWCGDELHLVQDLHAQGQKCDAIARAIIATRNQQLV